MAFPSSVRRGMPFPRLTHDHRRSHFGPGLSVSPLRSPGCTGKEKELTVLFTTPHSFFIEFEKRHFNSSRVPLHFGRGSFPYLSPGIIRSFSFLRNEYHPRKGTSYSRSTRRAKGLSSFCSTLSTCSPPSGSLGNKSPGSSRKDGKPSSLSAPTGLPL